jgi:hypothetical protein
MASVVNLPPHFWITLTTNFLTLYTFHSSWTWIHSKRPCLIQIYQLSLRVYLKHGSPTVPVVTFHLQHMVCFLRPHLLTTVLLHIKTTIVYDCIKPCMFRWTAMPCRTGPELSVAVSNPGLMPAVVQAIILYIFWNSLFVISGTYLLALYQLEILSPKIA